MGVQGGSSRVCDRASPSWSFWVRVRVKQCSEPLDSHENFIDPRTLHEHHHHHIWACVCVYIYKRHNLLYKFHPLTQAPGSHLQDLSLCRGGFQGQQLHLSEPPLQMQPRAHLAQPGGQQGQQPGKVSRWTDELWLFTSHCLSHTLGGGNEAPAAGNPRVGGCGI